jgi:Holliday junction DNA helicase RuvB
MNKSSDIFKEEKTDLLENMQEVLLRPKDFNEFIGQKKVIQNLEIMIDSANLREKALDHILLSGPPGLGKTSLAMIISDALKSNLHVISGPSLKKKGRFGIDFNKFKF